MTLVLSGVVSIGMFITVRTDNAAGATVAAVVITIASQILDQIASLRAIHAFLPTHGWRGFVGAVPLPGRLAADAGRRAGERRLHGRVHDARLALVPPPRRDVVAISRRP